MSAVVELNHLYKQIGKQQIIKDLSFTINEGEIFGFLGPNGAGKTTTIRMMVGLTSVTSGEVLIKGDNIQTDFKKAIAHVGAIVENPEFYSYLTGFENLMQFARMSTGVKREWVEELSNLVGLEGAIHKKVKTYSLGMRQRLGVAQALLHKPSVLILDEPTNGLDPAGIREFRGYIKELAREQNLAVLVSSHLLSEIELMCDKVGIIKNGEMIDVRSIKDFLSEKSGRTTRFTVDDLDKAINILKQQFPDVLFKRNMNSLDVTISKEYITSIIKAFSSDNLEIYEISSAPESLEDKFLALTGGED
ncbi:ABC transporter ATP-binding protein [Bacillus sp. V2I10]|uniref:ABC transporter ATP-binding protein n=1 Tax=Bacillus sp. V2I10 TaxID=3042276 RepID=UPI00277D9106|nr:ABC transporter ATP-binding protein [Bacillus sp. V2I10]MDQ0861123.1 ABC-2 type transport system ATP-binding protein [Bacillus sp. V2I10]